MTRRAPREPLYDPHKVATLVLQAIERDDAIRRLYADRGDTAPVLAVRSAHDDDKNESCGLEIMITPFRGSAIRENFFINIW